jgi:chromosome segregation ATPase
MTNDIAKHEAIIAKLSKKHGELTELAAQIKAKRAALALPANTGDTDAAKELHGLNKEALEIGLDLENVGNAIEQAKAALDKTRVDAATAQRREGAKEVQALLGQFQEHGRAIDAAFGQLAEHGHGLHEILTAMHARGCAFPSDQQVKVNLNRALASSAMLLPKSWRSELGTPHMPAHQLVFVRRLDQRLGRHHQQLGRLDRWPAEQ